MGQILVRNLDDEVIEQLKARALERGTSLEQLARDALTEVAGRSDRRAWLAELDALRARTAEDATHGTVEGIRAAREELARRSASGSSRRDAP